MQTCGDIYICPEVARQSGICAKTRRTNFERLLIVIVKGILKEVDASLWQGES